MMRTSTARLCRRPTGRTAPLLQHVQQLRLQRERHLADLVEEERAAVGLLEAGPARRAAAPVNAPCAWPNSSLSSRCSGSAAQLTATNGRLGAPASACSARATSPLPVPVSPVMMTGAGASATRWMRSRTAAMAGCGR